MEAKWAENPDAADAKQIVKVRGWLGALAADEHWIVCRTSHEHLLAKARLVSELGLTSYFFCDAARA